MHLEKVKKWLNGEDVDPEAFKVSLHLIINDYERLKEENFRKELRNKFPLEFKALMPIESINEFNENRRHPTKWRY